MSQSRALPGHPKAQHACGLRQRPPQCLHSSALWGRLPRHREVLFLALCRLRAQNPCSPLYCFQTNTLLTEAIFSFKLSTKAVHSWVLTEVLTAGNSPRSLVTRLRVLVSGAAENKFTSCFILPALPDEGCKSWLIPLSQAKTKTLKICFPDAKCTELFLPFFIPF